MGSTSPLADKDRIFTNVYGFQSPDLKAAQARGDWDKTADLMKIGQDAIIVIVIAWKLLKGLLGLAIGVGLAALVVYGGMKLIEGPKR